MTDCSIDERRKKKLIQEAGGDLSLVVPWKKQGILHITLCQIQLE
jgi:hypothetical protein